MEDEIENINNEEDKEEIYDTILFEINSMGE